MREKITQAASDGFLRLYGIEREVEAGPLEWLEGFGSFVSQAQESIRATLHDDEAFVLGKALRGEEIPGSWGEVQRQMALENQQIVLPQSENVE